MVFWVFWFFICSHDNADYCPCAELREWECLPKVAIPSTLLFLRDVWQRVGQRERRTRPGNHCSIIIYNPSIITSRKLQSSFRSKRKQQQKPTRHPANNLPLIYGTESKHRMNSQKLVTELWQEGSFSRQKWEFHEARKHDSSRKE